jgi:rubrerythrin
MDYKDLEQYFAGKELEKLKAFREKRRQEQVTQEKEELKRLHYMHCPKCGTTMETVKMENIEIDKCPNCLGLYFDNQELEQLLQAEFEKRKSVVRKIFGL